MRKLVKSIITTTKLIFSPIKFQVDLPIFNVNININNKKYVERNI